MSRDATDQEAALQRSWRVNANAWTDAVREQRIASRRAGTDAAIVDAVLHGHPRRVLDLGCGEGWLARALGLHGIEVTGVDASPELIAAARAHGGARFEVASYAQLASRVIDPARFDAIACNFALLAEDLHTPLQAARQLLEPRGRLVVQTVHPWTSLGDTAYVDGWRVETFDRFGAAFEAPMPWYFRTLASWMEAFRDNGFTVAQCREPAGPDGSPLSLLFVATGTAYPTDSVDADDT